MDTILVPIVKTIVSIAVKYEAMRILSFVAAGQDGVPRAG